MPAGSVVLPAENSKGILTSTLLGACACTLTTASPKKMPKMATNLYILLFITTSTYRTRQLPKNGLSHKRHKRSSVLFVPFVAIIYAQLVSDKEALDQMMPIV